MNLEKEAVKLATKGGKWSLKQLWSWWRPWRTKKAYEREVAEEMKKHTLKAMLLGSVMVGLTGCASLDKVYTTVDRTVYNGQLDPYQNQIPDGYMVKPYVLNAQNQRVDITGWSVEQELVRSAEWRQLPLEATIQKRRQSNPVADVIRAAIEQPQPASGAADAQSLLFEAAKEAGVK